MNQRRTAPLEVAERMVQAIGTRIESDVPYGWGYTLCLSEYGDGGRLVYASNCSKESVVAVSHELAKRIESGDDSSFTIHPSDSKLSVTLDEALELLASIGRALSSNDVNVLINADDDGRDRMRALLDNAMSRAEALVLEHRPDLLSSED